MNFQDIRYVGVNDHELDLFEGQYRIPNGMAYNSYIITDEKIAVVDAVDARFTEVWFENINNALNGKAPDYLIVQHMEPDHSGSIMRFMETYPGAKPVATAKAFTMIRNFFGVDLGERAVVVGDGDTLGLGRHELRFLTAAMIHWPEVMMTYDSTEKVLFSADAFGKFGALDAEEDWACEARRYYFGIVGKYGIAVQNLFKKIAGLGLDIQAICPLHGPALTENLSYYLHLYDVWSSYEPEEEGIMIAYTSIYGNTKKAVDLLVEELKALGCEPAAVTDLARCDMAEAVEDAFRYSKLVFATTTYNGGAFPFMREFLYHLAERSFSKRFVAFMENGSWAPMAKRAMENTLEKCKNLTYAANSVKILSALNDESIAQVKALARELAGKQDAPAEEAAIKKFVCKVCGYVHEGRELPADFICPICQYGAEAFEELK